MKRPVQPDDKRHYLDDSGVTDLDDDAAFNDAVDRAIEQRQFLKQLGDALNGVLHQLDIVADKLRDAERLALLDNVAYAARVTLGSLDYRHELPFLADAVQQLDALESYRGANPSPDDHGH